MKGSETSPPAFSWDDWYSSVGGRSIHITEVDAILHQIKEYQYPKFTGEVNSQRTVFETPGAAAAALAHAGLAAGFIAAVGHVGQDCLGAQADIIQLVLGPHLAAEGEELLL